MFIRSLILSVIVATFSFGQTVTLPAKVEVEPGRLAAVKVQWDGDDIRWIVSPELDVFREYDPNPEVIRLRVQGFTEGKFKIIAITCKDKKLSEFAACEVIVGKPGPEPGPNPGPADPLLSVLQQAYKSDTGDAATKSKNKDALRAVYKQASELDLTTVKTAAELFTVLRNASKGLLADDALFATRTAITGPLKEILPTNPNAELTQDHRANAKSLFIRLTKVLESLK